MAAKLAMISPMFHVILVFILLPLASYGSCWRFFFSLSRFDGAFPASHLQQDWLEILCTCFFSPSAGLLVIRSGIKLIADNGEGRLWRNRVSRSWPDRFTGAAWSQLQVAHQEDAFLHEEPIYRASPAVLLPSPLFVPVMLWPLIMTVYFPMSMNQ